MSRLEVKVTSHDLIEPVNFKLLSEVKDVISFLKYEERKRQNMPKTGAFCAFFKGKVPKWSIPLHVRICSDFEWGDWMEFFVQFVSWTMAAVADVCAGLLRHKHILLRELCETNILDVLVKKGILKLNEFELITGAADSDKCNYFIEIVSKQSGVKLNDLCVVLNKECSKLSKELMNDRHRFIVNGEYIINWISILIEHKI